MIKHVETLNEFEKETKFGKVLVDFFATWCGPCKMLSPVLEQADKEGVLGCDVIKVDVDELPEAAGQFGVQAIPTLVVLVDGKEVNRRLGYLNKNQLIDLTK